MKYLSSIVSTLSEWLKTMSIGQCGRIISMIDTLFYPTQCTSTWNTIDDTYSNLLKSVYVS